MDSWAVIVPFSMYIKTFQMLHFFQVSFVFFNYYLLQKIDTKNQANPF